MLADYRYVRRRVCVREHTINACCYGPRHGDRVAEAQRNRPTCSGDLEKPPVGRARNPKTGWEKAPAGLATAMFCLVDCCLFCPQRLPCVAKFYTSASGQKGTKENDSLFNGLDLLPYWHEVCVKSCANLLHALTWGVI